MAPTPDGDTTKGYPEVISPTGASPPPSPASKRIGPYELLSEVARGGMGVVFQARDTRLQRTVALKLLLPQGDPDEMERFRIEAQASARLNHPGVVTIHEVGDHQGRPYLIMDFVEGESLHDRIKRQGHLKSSEAGRIAARIATALAYAHSRLILHRDIKPRNVLLDATGEPKLTDFGLAKDVGAKSRGLTATGQILGTPAFMPPEQASGQPERIDGRADVYGLGATLYAMLTGRPPFQGASIVNVLAKVCGEPPAPPSVLQPSVDPGIEAICLRCLEKDPADRYPTAQALADDLDRYLAGQPSLPRPREASRPRRWSHALSLLAGAALATGVGAWFPRDVADSPRTDIPPTDVLPAKTTEPVDTDRLDDLANAPHDAARGRGNAKVAAALDAIEAGDHDAEAGLTRVLTFADPATPALLAERLDVLSARIEEASRAVVLEAEEPDAAEVLAGQSRIYGLPDALDSERREDLSAKEAASLTQARKRVVARWQADDFAHLVARRQGQALTPGGVTLVRVLCSALMVGAPRGDARALDALRRYLLAELDDERAVRPALALLQLGALRDLHLVRWLRRRYSSLGAYWQRVLPVALELTEADSINDSAEDLCLLAEAHAQRGAVDRALSTFAEAIRRDPRLATAWLGRGTLREAKGDKGGAETDYTQAIDLDPTLARSWWRRAQLRDATGEKQAALDDWTELSRRERRRPLVWLYKGNANFALRRPEAAEFDSYRSLALDPSNAEAWRLLGLARLFQGRREEAASDLKTALDLDPQHAESWYNLADVCYRRGSLREAVSLYSRALDLDPLQALALLGRANVRKELGDLRGAADDLERCLSVAGDKDTTWAALIALHNQTRDIDAALDTCERGLARLPDSQLLLGARARIRRLRGDLRGALADCDRVVKLGPERYTVWLERADARKQAGDLSGATEDLTQALKLRPQDEQAWFDLTRLYINRDETRRAAQTADLGLRSCPDSAYLHNARGCCRMALGDVDGALIDFDAALKLDPAHHEARVNRGNLKRDRREFAAAIVDYDYVGRASADYPQVHFEIGRCEQALGRKEQAISSYERYLRLAAQGPLAKLARKKLSQLRGDD